VVDMEEEVGDHPHLMVLGIEVVIRIHPEVEVGEVDMVIEVDMGEIGDTVKKDVEDMVEELGGADLEMIEGKDHP